MTAPALQAVCGGHPSPHGSWGQLIHKEGLSGSLEVGTWDLPSPTKR